MNTAFYCLLRVSDFRKRGTMCFYVVALIFGLLTPSFSYSLFVREAYGQEQAMLMEELETVQSEMPLTHSSVEEFKPTMWKPLWVDQDNNGIDDSLDQEIADRVTNGTAGDPVNVIVALKSEPTAYDAHTFALCGGYVITSPWKYAIYGFGGQIPYNKIADFAQRDLNVLLVEKEAVAHATIAYATSQVGARTYVWNTLGLQGDTNSSIAIIDTGIDDSHPDFSPGFSDQDFTQKIVGWNDQINPDTTSPYDDNGHGSHVSGLAAGNGFFSTDDSGNAIVTWGANLGRITSSGTYLVSGMMVNRTGIVTIKVKWTNTNSGAGAGRLSALPLYYGDKTLSTGNWTEVASVSTPNRDMWYTLTYNVTSNPSDGYDMYHITMSLTAGAGDLYVVFTMSWPYTPPTDGFSAWTGIAPQTKLVEVKVLDYSGTGTSTGLLNAIDWIIANREAYHIVITSMSLGFSSEVSTVDTAVANLVNSGITTIVSAGNSGPGGNRIYTPGSVDEVITVAAINQFDNIAHYSSQGGTSRYEGNTTKPDIAAPGGSFFAVPLLSADSNDGDADLGWSEVTLDDGAPMQGTSMSAPIVAGAANIIVEAMGGFASWQYTRSQALLPKMILLMTATETYPNLREYYTSDSPTLERGGKDVHEGYGRLNLDVAVDAVLKTYEIGTTVTETLGKPPTLSDISVLGQKLAWARKTQLVQGWRYNFTLDVPAGADYDLYLYNGTGTWYGEPAIVAKSTKAATGGYEQLVLNATYTGTYYLVVKRATATTGGGTFTLQSSYTPEHNVAVVAVEPFGAAVYEGNTLNITVTVKNEGLSVESFNVTVFYDSIVISKQEVVDLAAGGVLNLTFYWNTVGVMSNINYTISAEADAVAGELEVVDNTFVDGEVFVKIAGDVNGDGTVDIFDIGVISAHWYPGPPIGPLGYDWYVDVNDDGAIDIFDVGIVSTNWGRSG